ncbi:MAG TPA: tyrosine--tRNA ligase [Candidatus Paceibacterota bacterium]|nr:tyrosine--tRNA ligase [Candidatus Paceibacterota bacterium]
MKLSETLRERGYVYQFSSENLEEITDGAKRTVYLGIDPTADSLHVGHLQAMLVLRRFLEDGHKVILLIGGGTGMIGDPSGKSEERNLLDAETLSHNAACIKVQAEQLFNAMDFAMVNNAHWLEKLNFIEFLRDIGKHFSVNAMLQRDSVKERLQSQEQGISYTEFSYMLLQAYDFLYLNNEYGCDLQIGASDQWGNIVSGVDLIRRKTGKTAYALSSPLLINKSTGKKFGKSEGGAIWLDAAKTSPFQFYQFWFNTEDDQVEEFLLKMTLLPKEEINTIMSQHGQNPSDRIAQRRLAHHVTAIVHGSGIATEVGKASAVLFVGNAEALNRINESDLNILKEQAPHAKIESGATILDVLILSELATSKREARQFVSDKAVTLNGQLVDESKTIESSDFIHDLAFLKRGKRNVVVLTLT